MTHPLLRRPIAAAAGAVVVLSLFGSAPARALDDGQETIFDSLLDLAKMGLGFPTGEAQDTIDYHERAPLVVPPKMDLPQPLPPVAKRNPNFPVDQTLARQRAAAAEARRPRANDVDADPLPARDLQKGRIPMSQQPRPVQARDCDDMDRLCDPNQFWATLKNTKKDDDSTRGLVAGVEPPRANLTDPPRGYRIPTKSVAATFEPRDDSYQQNLGSGAAQVREEARRAREAE
jgi:hypothetical protein